MWSTVLSPLFLLFVTTWKTDNPGITADNQIQIKTAGGGYNYTVDWGDGQTNNNVAGDITHTYATAGTYTVSITGDFPRIVFVVDDNITDAPKLLSIEQWGNIQWQSMSYAFSGCINLVGNASDVPDLSRVTDMSGMFLGATSFNQDIRNWDVSAVTDMSQMLYGADTFNQDISNWNVSAVTNMNNMFSGITLSTANYDALLSGWSAQSLQNGVVFSGGNSQYSPSSQAARDTLTEAFNWTVTDGGVITVGDSAPIITNTNLSPGVVENTTSVTAITVTDIDSTTFTYTLSGVDSALFNMTGNTLSFITAPDFENPQDSGTDNIYNVTVVANDGTNDSTAKAFVITVTDTNDSAPVITNTNLTPSLEENTTAVTAIAVTDIDSTTFTYTLSGVDSALFNMMGNTLGFIAAPDFENPQDSGTDNIYNVTLVANDGTNDSAAAAFTITVTGTDDVVAPIITLNGTNPVTIIQGTTYTDAGANATDDQDGSVGVTTSGSVNTSTIDTYTITYNATDTAGNTSSTTRTVNVVMGPDAFVTTWKTDNPGISADNQIQIRTSGGGYNYTVNWGDGQIDSSVAGNITHTYATVGTYTVSITGNFPRIVFGEETDAQKLLSIEQWGSIQWQSMNNAFAECRNLVGNASDVPDLSQVMDVSGMFSGTFVFNQDLSSWDVSSVTNMSNMFSNALIFNQDLSNWDVSSVTSMTGMFFGTDFNQNLSTWDVSAVTDMSNMFHFARDFNQDISSWDVSSVTNMSNMFFSASTFNQDINNWDVSSVTNMKSMFGGTRTFNQNLSNWNVSSVKNMAFMFNDADAFNQDLSNWDVSSVTDMFRMFLGITLSLANYDALLLGWSTQSLQRNVSFHGGTSQYSPSSQAARDTLTDVFGWTVTDGETAY